MFGSRDCKVAGLFCVGGGRGLSLSGLTRREPGKQASKPAPSQPPLRLTAPRPLTHTDIYKKSVVSRTKWFSGLGSIGACPRVTVVCRQYRAKTHNRRKHDFKRRYPQGAATIDFLPIAAKFYDEIPEPSSSESVFVKRTLHLL